MNNDEMNNLLLCIRSGQVSAKQIEQHLRDDEGFAEFHKRQVLSRRGDERD